MIPSLQYQAKIALDFSNIPNMLCSPIHFISALLAAFHCVQLKTGPYFITRNEKTIYHSHTKLLPLIKHHLTLAYHTERSIITIFILKCPSYTQKSETPIFINSIPLIPNVLNGNCRL